MFSVFTNQLYARLLKSGFAPIRRMYDSDELSEDTKYTGLSRNRGPVSHVVFLVNVGTMGLEQFIKNSSDYINNLRRRAELLNFRNLVVAFVLVTEEPAPEVSALVELTDRYFESSALRLYWHVVLSEKQVINFKGSENFLNIDKLLQESLHAMDDALFVPRKYEDMRAEWAKKNLLPVFSYTETLVFLFLMVNLAVCLAMDFYDVKGNNNFDLLVAYGALEPQKVILGHEYYRLISSNFVHTGTVHLIITSLCLYTFGSLTERYMGTARFLLIYLLAGLFGNLLALTSPQLILFAGATASIFGLAGAMLAVTYKTGKEAKGFSADLLLIFLIIGLYLGFASSNFNNLAHMGGFVSGYFLGYVLYAAPKTV